MKNRIQKKIEEYNHLQKKMNDKDRIKLLTKHCAIQSVYLEKQNLIEDFKIFEETFLVN